MRFLENESLTATLAMDEAEAAFEHYHSTLGHRRTRGKPGFEALAKHAKNLQAVCSAWVNDRKGAPLYRWILELPENLVHAIVQMVLSEVVLDDDLSSHQRLKLLVVNWAAHELTLWTNKMLRAR